MNSDQETPISIGIDFGGTSVKIGLCRGPEMLDKLDPIPTEEYPGSEKLIAAMAEGVSKLKSQHKGITAVGVGIPGFVDWETGRIHELTNVPGWVDVPLRETLSEATGLPVTADNDANCMTYAEFSHGAGQGTTNMIAVTLGTGVGGGIIINGDLFRGSLFGAGEIGQMSVSYKSSRPGSYGNTGALEEYIGNNEIAARAKYLYQLAAREVPASDCTPHALSLAAASGDETALRVWDEVSTVLACGLSNCAWLLNPEAIIIGGGVAKAGDLLFGPLRQKIRNQLAETFSRQLRVEPAKFSNDAGIVGSAAMAVRAAQQS